MRTAVLTGNIWRAAIGARWLLLAPAMLAFTAPVALAQNPATAGQPTAGQFTVCQFGARQSSAGGERTAAYRSAASNK